MLQQNRQLVLHTIGSIIFLSIPIFFSPDFDSWSVLFSIVPFKRNFLCYILLLIFFYFNYFYLIPRFYFTKKRIVFFCIIVFCYLFIAYVPSLIIPMDFHHFSKPDMDFPMPRMPHRNFIRPFEGDSVIQFLLIFALSFLLKINDQLTNMQSEKLKAEVSYLKAQINPHFLFNTLNSLYALTIEKSNEAPKAVLKLSNMMRYVVTESTQDFVSMEKEIGYIKDYIDLQLLRMDENTQFSFEIKGNPAGKCISPLILIPFIENAFKYGLNPEENSGISIFIDIREDELYLETANNIVSINIPDEEKTEKGTENTKKRLSYLYPKKHKILIFDTPETFQVKLTISLK